MNNQIYKQVKFRQLDKEIKVLLRYSQVFKAGARHDICQKHYATAVLGARILRKKCVDCDITQFATKERNLRKVCKIAQTFHLVLINKKNISTCIDFIYQSVDCVIVPYFGVEL